MPPHTTLHYTMPPNTTNSKSTATTANNGTTQMNTNNKSATTPTTKTTRQRRATSGSSYIFAPSWLTNLNNKSGPSSTVLNSAYVSTTEEKSVKEDLKGVGALKKDALGGSRQVKEGLGKDGSSSLNRSLINGVPPLSPNRSRSRDYSGPRLSGFDEIENHESPINKIHSRSRSVSQVNQPLSSSSSFDKNFPTLAKKKQMNLSVDLPTKNVENIWANSDTKSKLLSPTSTTPNAEEHTKFNIPNIDDEPELERRMSLVPKVEIGKLDGKRVKHTMKRKTSRSLSVDSVARGPNGSSVFGFGVGIGISNNRSIGQSQNARTYLTTSKPTGIQPQRQRAASISTSNGIKKASSTTPRVGGFGQSTISGRKSSISGNSSKYLWSNATMGKMGSFKIEEDDDYEGHLNDRKEDINYCDHIEEEEEEEDEGSVEEISISNNNKKVVLIKDEIIDSNQNVHNSNHAPTSSIESEEKFLLQLGWQKPYNKEADSNEWAITEEEKRFFVKLIRALNGIAISESNMTNELSRNEIECAKKKWAALVKTVNINGGNKIFNMRYQSNVAKHVTFNDENGRNNH